MTALVFNLVVLLVATAIPGALCQYDIVPVPYPTSEATFEAEQQVFRVDRSGLGFGREFYEREVLAIQLLPDLPVWTVNNVGKGGNLFVGESKDKSISCNLMRYVPNTDDESPDTDIIVGVVQDRANHLWYEIKPNFMGQDIVTIVHDQDIPPLGNPLDREEDSFWERLGSIDLTSISLKQGLSNVYARLVGPKATTVIDVMVIWTANAECAKSSLEIDCNLNRTTLSNMRAAVDLMVSESNLVHNNSETGVQFSVVHMQRDTSGYKERNLLNLLDAVTDGNLGNTHDLRDQYKADLVMWLFDNRLNNGDFAGYAWYPQTVCGFPDVSRGYSVVAAQYTSMDYIPAHEWGHNLGCRHDRGTERQCNAGGCNSPTYYGYRSPAGNFRTVMAYPCRTGQCDNYQGSTSCSVIPYFSGHAEYNNDTLGGSKNSCRKEIIAQKNVIAGYK